MKSRKVLLAFNPKAGHGRFGLDRSSIADKMKSAASRLDTALDLEVRTTSGKGDCLDAALEASSEGYDVFAAAGGDGTVMEAVNGLVDSGTALGIVPIGSGNDTIFSITGSRDIERCLEGIAVGPSRKLDLGLSGKTYFLNVLGIGLDAEINHEVARRSAGVRRWGPLLTYAMSAMRVLGKYRPYDVEVTLGGMPPLVVAVGLFTIGNGTTCGGGFDLTPRAKMDDGLLDVSISEHPGFIRSILNIRTAMKGRHVDMKETKYFQVPGLRVRGIDRDLPYHMDGEGGFARELKIIVHPASLLTVH